MEKLIVQITSGKGPEECCRAVARVQEYFLEEARRKGFDVRVLSGERGNLNGTLRSTLLLLKGSGAADFAEGWKGTILWISESPYRKMHRRKNWFVGLETFPVPSKITFREQDVIFETFRGGGPGGQHVNKVETAVRGRHVPSGLTVVASDSRSQLQNRKHCLERLREKAEAVEYEAAVRMQEARWLEHHQLERGNPVRVFRQRL